MVSRLSTGNGTLASAHPEEAYESRNKPEKSREEAKGDHGLGLPTLISVNGIHVVPVKYTAARVSNEL